ncbi:MAG: hypothetical protein H6587_00545 [Flavobacteriales bacterium]|nr:hypothetical protein [Flavobacteriales bacterium]
MEYNYLLEDCNIYIEIFKILIAIIGIYIVVQKMQKSTAIKQSEYFKELYYKVFEDDDLKRIFLDIDYGNITDARTNRETEEKIDKLLAQYNVICYFYDKGLISESEIRLFNYRFKRVYQSEVIKAYLKFLTEFYKKNNTNLSPFEHFVKYSKDN